MKKLKTVYTDKRQLAQAFNAISRTYDRLDKMTVDHQPSCDCPLCNVTKPALADATAAMREYALKVWQRELSQIISYAGGKVAK